MIMFGKCDHPTWRDAQSTHFNFASYAYREKIKVTLIPYSEILDVWMHNDIQSNKSTHFISNKKSVFKRWSFKFTVKCQNRTFHFLAPSEDERNLWTFTFNWII